MYVAAVNVKDGQQYIENNNYANIYNKIWGMATKEDTKSSDDIIKETFEQHGIKIIKG